MLYYARTIVKPENRCFEPPGQEAAHALESLVESGVRSAVRLRPDPYLSVDGALSCGYGYPQGTAGGHQHRTRPGIGARLLRPAPGLLPQPGPESAPAHLRLVCPRLPRPPWHPTRQRQARPRRRWHQDRQGRTQDARSQETPSTVRVKHQAGVHLRPLLPGGRRTHSSLSSVFALPLACRIHEGTVFSNRDHRTLLDKMILLLDSLGIPEPCYFVADAYYAAGNIVRGLLAHGNHLVTRVKSNSVAFFPATPPPS